ncbi:unnamed protein product [Notodromas monacha]|uniref:5-demethoxyubiquinone hydroxylase, mitochondrial n=1 Tax=Notodromas monacha TaxID=399045 RepID=A0A7R9BWV4_9CRUS|nr:unnamed protein product [Notodromas monacha]CAG0923204.1 unnamed protein product [Notodromas monacha]
MLVPRVQLVTVMRNLSAARMQMSRTKKRELIDRIIRVDHAGEYGADRIYAGQVAVLGNTSIGPTLQHMWDQEKVHRATFEKLIPKYRARPTALLPIWNIAGFALGAGTALLGKQAAMACTVAVESVIGDHYNDQIREILEASDDPEEYKELLDVIRKFRDEELEHHDTALKNDAELAPFYSLMSQVIKAGCKVAIYASEQALAVDDAWAGLVVLLLGDPHLLEGGQGRQDGAADPDGVLPLGRCDDLDLDGGRRQGGDFLLHPVGDTRVHGGAAGEDGVGVEVLTDVHVALHDGVVDRLVDAAGLHAQERGLEQGLGAPEPLVADGDDLAIGQLVGLLQGSGRRGGGHFLLKVQGHVAQLLLDVTHDFPLSCNCMGWPVQVGLLPHPVPHCLVDGYGVGHAVARVQDDTRRTTGSVERKHGLDGDVHGRAVEGLEHDLCGDEKE